LRNNPAIANRPPSQAQERVDGKPAALPLFAQAAQHHFESDAMKLTISKPISSSSFGAIVALSARKPAAMAFLLLAASLSAYPQSDTPTAQLNGGQSSLAPPTDEKRAAENKLELPEFHEAWNQLSIKGIGLQQYMELPGGTVDRPQFTREMVRLEWRPDDPVDLYISLPKGVLKPRVVLYLYGYPSDASRFTADDWCIGATQGGFAAVGFVSALTGERYRHRPLKEWFISELQESLAATTHDVQMILNYLQTRSDLNTDQVAMYAQGSGASIAVLAASVDSRISVLDLLNPWGDWPDWLKKSQWIDDNERASYLRPEFLEKVSGLDPVRFLPGLTQVVRLQQVKDDRITPTAARERMAASVPPGAAVLESDCWATYWKAWKEKRLWDWARERLKAKPVQSQAMPTTAPNTPNSATR
jgi:hypothetical protein